MLELLRLAVALVGSAFGGWKDFRTTDVPDRLVFGMVGAGLFLNFVEWTVFGSWELFQYSVLATAGFAAFGFFMYKAGAWGGGDGAMLTAIGSLLPAWPLDSVPFPLTFLPFPVAYFGAVFLVGLVWSVSYIVARVMRNGTARKKFAGVVRRRWPLAAASALASVLSVLFSSYPFSVALAVMFVALPFMYALVAVAEPAFRRRISTRLLRAGDMLGEDIPELKLGKRELRGLTGAEVGRIRRARKEVMIHEGIPYTPSFLFALIVLLLLQFTLA